MGPGIKAKPIAEKYSSRFAQYYRKQLDSMVTGAQLPQPLMPEQAEKPAENSDFLSAAEATAVAQDVARRFESIVQNAIRQNPHEHTTGYRCWQQDAHRSG